MSEVTQVLQAMQGGDARAAERLLVLLYDDLRRLAAQKLTHEKPGQTLDATALVHEVYLRILPQDGAAVAWQSRGHFFAVAAEAMRRILIDRARHKAAQKSGGGANRVPLDDMLLAAPDARENLLELDEALTVLEKHDAQAAQLVKLRFYAGLGHQEAAEALGLNRGAADRLWAVARSWLYRQLNSGS